MTDDELEKFGDTLGEKSIFIDWQACDD